MSESLKLFNGKKVAYDVYVNYEKHRVTAVAFGCDDLALYSCSDHLYSLSFIEFEEECLLIKQLYMPFSYTARASCHPADRFDPEIGTTIAVTRLKNKLERAVKRRQKLLAKELRRIVASLES